MEVYGFKSNTVFGLLSVKTVYPIAGTKSNDWYDYNQFQATPPFNNPFIPPLASNATYGTDFPDWISPLNNKYDLRGFYLYNCGTALGNIGGYCQKF
jgi:hypothetical protein